MGRSPHLFIVPYPAKPIDEAKKNGLPLQAAPCMPESGHAIPIINEKPCGKR